MRLQPHCRKIDNWFIAGLSFLFSTIHLFSGISGESYYSTSPVSSFIVLFFIYCLLIRFLFRWFALRNTPSPSSLPESKVFLYSFFFLLLCWLPYYFCSFPGNITWDTGTSILAYLGISQNHNNPPFLDWLYGMVYQAGILFGSFSVSTAIFCTVQMLLYLCAYSYATTLVSRTCAPRWLRFAVLLLYGVLPMFPMYALCIGKDSSFALPLLIFCLGIFDQLSGERFYDSKLKICIFLFSCILIPLTRNGAVWIVTIPLAVLVFSSRFTPPRKSHRIYLLSALILSCLTGFLLPRLLTSHSPSISESLSIPLQQTAYYFNHYPVTEQEQYLIGKVIPTDALLNYNCRISDPVKQYFRNDASVRDILNYFIVWIKQFLKHPLSYFKAFYLHTDAYYTPGLLRSDIKPHIFLGFNSTSDFNALIHCQNANPGLNYISCFDEMLSSTFGLRLLQSIGFYTWVFLISIAYALRERLLKNTQSFILPLIPVLLVLIACCFSPVNGYLRYAFPAIVCIPTLFILTVFSGKVELTI